MKKIKRRPILTTTIIIIVIYRNVSAPALSAVELEDGIISMPVLDSEWSVFSLLVGKLTSFYLTQDQRSLLPSSSGIGFSGGEL